MPKIELIQGNCLEKMKDIPDKSIDAIITDLPYQKTACKWDKIIPFEPLWKQYKRIIKDNGAIVLTASQPFTSALVMSNPGWFKYDFCWDKHNITGFLQAKKMPLRRHEDVIVFSPAKIGNFTYNPQMTKGRFYKRDRSTNKVPPAGVYGSYKKVSKSGTDDYYPTSVINSGVVLKNKSVHPTQKPVALFEYLIKTYTNEGDLVLDNCMGSGTTGIACKNLNRSFIGIELDQTYYEIAKKRINDNLSETISAKTFHQNNNQLRLL